MKKILFIFIAFVLSVPSFAQLSKARVDEIIEMSGIVWNLAGADEYSQCGIESYNKDIKQYFKKFRKHELVKYCKQLRKERAIGYDAVYNASIILHLENDSIVLSEGYTAKHLAEKDERWTEEAFEQYVILLNQFFRDTNFMSFFNSQNALYDKVEDTVNDKVYGKINEKWFENMFGCDFPKFNLYVSPILGPGNFGGDTRMPEDRKGICLGVLGTTKDNNIRISIYAFATAIHEIMHAFANPLVYENMDRFKKEDMETLWKCSDKIFWETAVGVHSLPFETLTRLFTCMYLADNGLDYKSQIGKEISVGFIWMNRCYDFMDNFRKNRNKYKYAGDYMPELAEYISYLASDIETVKEEYRNMRPVIEEITPAPGSELDLSEDFVTFTIRFSEDMRKSSSVRIIAEKNLASANPEKYGLTAGSRMNKWSDKRTFTITIPTALVKDYGIKGFKFNYMFYVNEYGFTMEEKEYKFIYKL